MENIKQHISEISKKSLGCLTTEVIKTNDFLIEMWHDMTFDELKFRLTDNSKPLHYKQAVQIDEYNYKFIDKVFEDKVKMISYKYPYYETVTPARMIEDTVGLLGTGNYTLIKESKEKKPDYSEVENIIYKALDKFRAIKSWDL